MTASLLSLLAMALGMLALYVFNKMIVSRLDRLDCKLGDLNDKLDANEKCNQEDHARTNNTLAIIGERVEAQSDNIEKLAKDMHSLSRDVARVDALSNIFKDRK